MASRKTACFTPLAMLMLMVGCGGTASEEVVVYPSVDDVFARPIAEQFEQATGIVVWLVPDTEETKSTGLVNRLIAERERSRADVFWSGDPVRAALLKRQGITASYTSPNAQGLPTQYSDSEGHWTGFSARARVLIYNRELVPDGEEPLSIMDLLEPRVQGQPTCQPHSVLTHHCILTDHFLRGLAIARWTHVPRSVT